MRVGFGALIVAVLAGCDRADPEPTTAAPSASAEQRNLSEFCERMCQRSARCGLELAAREAGPADVELMGRLEAERPEQERSCRDACGADALDSDATRFQLERVEICLRKLSCDELAACMDAM